MTSTFQAEKKWNTARLVLVFLWFILLGRMHLPTMMQTVEVFLNPENEMLYGWFVAPVALLMMMSLWPKLRVAAGRPAWGGLVLLLASFILTLLDRPEAYPPQLAMILAIPAVAWTGWGRNVARLLIFPTVFLLFIIPLNLPGLDNESLSAFSGVVSSALMNGIGFNTELFYELNEQTGVYLTNPALTFQFHVADVCSGKRSVAVLLVMSAVYGFFHYKTLPRILLLMVCSIPFVLVANIVRIIVMCFFTHLYKGEKMLGLFHDADGFIMFFIAFIFLAKVGDKYFLRIGKNFSDEPPPPPVRQSEWPVGIVIIILGVVSSVFFMLIVGRVDTNS